MKRHMAVSPELSSDEARLLLEHLAAHLKHLDAELVRTDQHDLQHALAAEVRSLQAIEERLSHAAPP